MNWDLVIWLTLIMLFSYWLTYAMGNPLDVKPDVRAILSFVPRYLANRRLQKLGMLRDIKADELATLDLTHGVKAVRETQTDQRRDRLELASKWFTWERSLLCPICLHWWLSLLFGVVCLTFNLLHARHDLVLAGLLYLVNHLLIRKIV